MADTISLLDFTCPRCCRAVTEEHYGPCRDCVSTLRAGQALNQTAVAAAEYIPKMNVTPNAVALKE